MACHPSTSLLSNALEKKMVLVVVGGRSGARVAIRQPRVLVSRLFSNL